MTQQSEAVPSRRSFLRGVLAVAAMAAVPAGAILAKLPILYSDGIHDDTPALQALFDGLPFRTMDGFAGIATSGKLSGGTFRVTKQILLNGNRPWLISHCRFILDMGHPLIFAEQLGFSEPSRFDPKLHDPLI